MPRGMDISIQTIIVLVISVIILVSLVVFYTGNAGTLFGSIGGLSEVAQNGTASAAEGAADVLEGLQ